MLRSLLPILMLIAAPVAAKPGDPKAAVEELLAADRNFSDVAANAADPVAGLAPMLDTEVVMPTPNGHAIGRAAVIAALRNDPSQKEGKVSWTPVRGGISADGTQGFTYGFLTLTRDDPAKRDRKYLAYWVRRPEGWRVVTYRNQVREPGEVSTAMLPPSIPANGVEPVTDASVIAVHQRTLAAAEKAFSDRAQATNLRIAFREYGREDAMNMYPGAGFTIGAEAISKGFDEGPAALHWATERSFAASSGDLGVSIGYLVLNKASANGKFRRIPFFTIWRRDGPDQPWRYIAE
ncbi:MAG TPA: nuclear transport factor 2 family protein [Sphingomicrobium sp.]|nr:nuclear transport factor 2 family protein [Sphingomicrobium sp.]